MSYKDEDIEALFRSLDDEKTEDDFIQDDAYALQANYLSEIERLSRLHGFNKKELANKIKISPS
jgi:predicted house-cleaning noncanonical NTP pyrophosphatase (MazG superfamily)